MLVEIFVMCAIMTNGTMVDGCEETWVVLFFDDFDLDWICSPLKDPEKVTVRGCSLWLPDRGVFMMIAQNGTATNNAGESTINHEVHHLWCLCHWHDDPPEPPNR